MLIGKNFDITGKILKDNETYIVKDNSALTNLITSYTDLKPGKSTGGHFHKGQEEIYIFVEGRGKIQIDNIIYDCQMGDTFAIPDGAFHKVFNDEKKQNLRFIAIFDGGRNH